VLAFRGRVRVEDRGNGDVEIRSFGNSPYLEASKARLEIIDFRADVDAAGESFEKTLGGIERRKVGRAPRARWTLATVPFERKFLMRWRKSDRAEKDQ